MLVPGQPVPRHCMVPRLNSRLRETHFQRWAGRLALQAGETPRTCPPWGLQAALQSMAEDDEDTGLWKESRTRGHHRGLLAAADGQAACRH